MNTDTDSTREVVPFQFLQGKPQDGPSFQDFIEGQKMSKPLHPSLQGDVPDDDDLGQGDVPDSAG